MSISQFLAGFPKAIHEQSHRVDFRAIAAKLPELRHIFFLDTAPTPNRNIMIDGWDTVRWPFARFNDVDWLTPNRNMRAPTSETLAGRHSHVLLPIENILRIENVALDDCC